VKDALTGRYAKWKELREEILRSVQGPISVLDPFSGRGMIPLEAARLGLPAYAIDYSPVAVLASQLLADYPFRDWSNEPLIPFGNDRKMLPDGERLVFDVESVLDEVGRRYHDALTDFYPSVGGKEPCGYLWAVTLPCQECGHRFPLVGSYELRQASER